MGAPCTHCGSRGKHHTRCPRPEEDRDPDVRRRCKDCRGPIYRDEPPGCKCPDCAAAQTDLHAAHAHRPPDATPRLLARVCRLWGGSP